MQLSLFKDVAFLPETEGIKYIGSKLKIMPHILSLIRSTDAKTVLDGFSGTTRIAQALARLGYQVIANDVAVWSKVFGECYLLNEKPPSYYAELIEHLNSLPPKWGWFTEHYGGFPNGGDSVQADGLKRPWQVHNTMKLDAIREEIDRLHLSQIEKSVLLTALILALDSVDNTVGHHASYLRRWAPRSYRTMRLVVPNLIYPQCCEHYVYQKDIFEVIEEVEADLAYFDPPYGSNNKLMPSSRVRYAAYYHLWTTIILNDKPALFGKARRREDTRDTKASSVFEEFRRNPATGRYVAVEAIERLLRKAQVRYILLSYSSGGRATAREIYEVVQSVGRVVKFVKVNYRKNVMAQMAWTYEWIQQAEEPHQEFLFLIEKA